MAHASEARIERFHIERSGTDAREPFQRDRDRVLYTSAFQRLAEVTQVVSPEEGHVFHNRLTHSLKVAQVARRIAERLIGAYLDLAQEVCLDPDVAEASALAHDLGHPPFGHLAEEELDQAVVEAGVPDGFDGNAQSLRIVTKLALKGNEYEGLNLTRATLDAILKYPWLRGCGGKKHRKWGAFHTEAQQFDWIRTAYIAEPDNRSIESEIMDWSDDITYAIHDVADFYLAGRIPLERLGSTRDEAERKRFLNAVFRRTGGEIDGFQQVALEKSFETLIPFLGFPDQAQGTRIERAALRSACSNLIGRYVNSITLDRSGREIRIKIDEEARKQVAMLKQLTWHYIILDDRLLTQQYGQRRLIRKLFWIHHGAASRSRLELFPAPYRERLQPRDSVSPEPLARVVADYIASMTEKQALRLYLRLTGFSPGSALH